MLEPAGGLALRNMVLALAVGVVSGAISLALASPARAMGARCWGAADRTSKELAIECSHDGRGGRINCNCSWLVLNERGNKVTWHGTVTVDPEDREARKASQARFDGAPAAKTRTL